MRVRLSLDVDDRDRYVIAKYYGALRGHATGSRIVRTRATRAQVRTFVAGALRSTVREHAEAFRGRQRTIVRRLAARPGLATADGLRAPAERQLNLLAGVATWTST